MIMQLKTVCHWSWQCERVHFCTIHQSDWSSGECAEKYLMVNSDSQSSTMLSVPWARARRGWARRAWPAAPRGRGGGWGRRGSSRGCGTRTPPSATRRRRPGGPPGGPGAASTATRPSPPSAARAPPSCRSRTGARSPSAAASPSWNK